MSNPNVQDFDRIISFRSLARARFLPAVASALFSALALACALLCITAIFWLLVRVDSASANPDVRTTGLLDLAARIASHPVGGAFSRMIRSVNWLHSTGSAIVLLLSTTCVLVLLRWALRSGAEAVVENRVAASVQRLRQHIHRKSIRLEPSDFSGENVGIADGLFRESTVFLETAGGRWGGVVLTAAADTICLLYTSPSPRD